MPASEPNHVAGIVLAAGRGSRFGSYKPLARVAGEPMVVHVIATLRAAGLEPVLVVTRPDPIHLGPAEVTSAVRVVPNPRADQGIGTSVAAGIGTCPPETGAAVVALADQPGITTELVRSLVEAWRIGRGRIVRPTWRGAPRHPVVFDRRYFGELMALKSDRGGRDVIQLHASDVHLVEVDDERLIVDIDTPDDAARFADA